MQVTAEHPLAFPRAHAGAAGQVAQGDGIFQVAVNPAKDLLQARLLHLAGGGRRGGRPPAQQQQNGGKFRPNLELIPRALLFTGMESPLKRIEAGGVGTAVQPDERHAAAHQRAHIAQIKQFQPVFGVFLTFGVGLHRGPVKDHAGRLLSLLL